MKKCVKVRESNINVITEGYMDGTFHGQQDQTSLGPPRGLQARVMAEKASQENCKNVVLKDPPKYHYPP